MTQQGEDTQTLTLNRSTGYYEGIVLTPTLVQVEKEIFDRVILLAMKEDTSADMTDPATLQRAVAREGKITNWLNKPHKETPIPTKPVPQEAQPLSVSTPTEQVKPETPSMPYSRPANWRQVVVERAIHVPPHLWEARCQTPVPDGLKNKKERQPTHNLRFDERAYLQELREKWKNGDFAIDPEAEEEEAAYQASQEQNIEMKVEAVALALKRNGLH